MLSLLVGWPQVHWMLIYRVDAEEFVFDDAPIKEELGDLPLERSGSDGVSCAARCAKALAM